MCVTRADDKSLFQGPGTEPRIPIMKLRLRGNSLRFRLTQGEVLKLLTEGVVHESVHFSAAQGDLFTYSLHSVGGSGGITARFNNGEIRVEVPGGLVETWANTDQVGIDSTQSIAEEKTLRIVIEKDFRCLQPQSDEDERDNFPNPLVESLENPTGAK